MKNNFLNIPVNNIYSKPNTKSEIISQILYGEKFKILNEKRGWIKIKTNYDNYIGYIKKQKFRKQFKPQLKIFKSKSRVLQRTEYTIVKDGELAGTGAHSYSKGSATSGSEEAAKYQRK